MSSLRDLPTPQQSRAIATRTRILGATITCLTEHGVLGATTTVIARQASVSQGALYKHFPAKPLLMAAATQQLFFGMREDFFRAAGMIAQQPEQSHTDAIYDLLWKTYSDPRVLGVFELYLAARTDPALKRLLEPVVSEHFQAITDFARVIFPDGAKNNPDFDDTVHAILLKLHGAALMATIMSAGPDRAALLRKLIQRLAQQELGALDLEVMAWKKP